MISTAVLFFSQSGGLNARNAYAAEIFVAADLQNPQTTAAYAVGGSAVLSTAISLFIVDRLGRKFLLLMSATGMLIGTTMLGTYFYVVRCNLSQNSSSSLDTSIVASSGAHCSPQLVPLVVVSIIVFSASYSIGWGPVAFVLVGELIPLRVRGVGSEIAALVNWTTATIVVGFYLYYAEKVGSYFTWWTFSLFNLAAIIFVAIFVYETKGKSLKELNNYS